MTLPTIVRLEDFPDSVRVGQLYTSGPVVHADRKGEVEVTLHIPDQEPMTATESFASGEQKAVLFDWLLESDRQGPHVVAQLEVRYAGESTSHTLPVPLLVESRARMMALVIGGTVAAALGAVVLAMMNRSRPAVEVEEEEVEVEVEEVESRPAPKKTPAKKASSKKSSSTKAPATKKAPARSAAATKKAPAKKQAGGTRRESAASQSAPRTGARGSSKGQKSAPARSRPKSR